MKKILAWLQHWFEHYGLIKILAAFVILAISVALGRRFENASTFFGWIAIISAGYLLLTFLIFFIAGIVNSIKDVIAKRNETKNTEE